MALKGPEYLTYHLDHSLAWMRQELERGLFSGFKSGTQSPASLARPLKTERISVVASCSLPVPCSGSPRGLPGLP